MERLYRTTIATSGMPVGSLVYADEDDPLNVPLIIKGHLYPVGEHETAYPTTRRPLHPAAPAPVSEAQDAPEAPSSLEAVPAGEVVEDEAELVTATDEA